MPPPRTVVLGGSGFIGSHLCDALLDAGHQVICVDNFVTGRPANVKHLENNPAFTMLEADVSEQLTIPGSINYVLHFASPASPVDFERMPMEILKAGSLATYSALELAKEKGAVFVFASSSEVYGDPLVTPQSEDYRGNVNVTGPRGMYDEAKRFGEALTMAYHRVHRVDTKVVRIFNTYGPRMRMDDGRVVPNFISQALTGRPITIYGDGSQTRSFCYISDLVDGVLRLMGSGLHEPVNLGSPDEFTVLHLAETVLRLTGARRQIIYKPLPEDDPRQRCPDISRAKTVLGWEPHVGLEEGLRRTITWFAKQELPLGQHT